MHKTKFGFGSSSNVEQALLDKKINARDILLLDEDTDNPKIGWVSKDGKPIILTDEKADLSEVESDVAALEEAMTKKADVEVVNTKIGELETALDDVAKVAYAHEKVKYEITDVPVGTIIDYRDEEIRIMCPKLTVFTKQSVGVGGNPNSYYMTFKTYAPNNDVVGYIEHLDNQVDAEVLVDLKTDKYGRKYQPTWLALADYDEATDSWKYRGVESTKDGYYGYNYQIDWYNADGVMIASDSVRISLSNEDCHNVVEPYYVGEMMKTVDEKIEEKIAEITNSIEIIEF